VGDTGCGRPGIGDVIRQLVLECLVRTLSVGSSGAPTRSAKVSIGHDAIEVELFGGFRSGTSEQSVGLLSECADSALFLDGALSMPENLRRRLLDAVEAMESGHTAQRVTTAANLHLIAGARRDEFSNLREKHSVTQALFQSLCRDGLLTIPRLGDVLASGARWHEIFDVVYRHVARTYCGLATPSLHRYGGLSQAFHSDDIDTDTVAEEQRTFLDWITAPARITQIADMVRIEFEGYDWPGNLREFEALMQRLIESQVTPELNPQKIMQACTDFRHRRTGPIEGQGSTSNWLLRFERELDALPLTHAALPQVMGQLEARYYREAAERAAVARHPKNARIQDVARMLGIPRQTAARKWQHYNLPSSLLTKDSNQDV